MFQEDLLKAAYLRLIEDTSIFGNLYEDGGTHGFLSTSNARVASTSMIETLTK